MSEVWDEPEFKAFSQDVRENLMPKLQSSGMALSILPSGEPDAKIAVEIGLILLLDKPLILCVMPGSHVPEGLARAAAAFVAWSDDPEVLQGRLHEALEVVQRARA